MSAQGEGEAKGRRLIGLALGALGVVYGDIGTSPLYAIKESFHAGHGLPLTQANVLGVLSLMVWSLTAVVSFKYIVFILRADNKGEGGIFALLALVPGLDKGASRFGYVGITLLTLFGAALLYGDGVITPAISVLSAVEGLGVATHALEPAIVPITVVILIGLFVVQRQGTGAVGKVFGPIMILWFGSLAVLGVVHIADNLEVLRAFDPRWAVQFFRTNGKAGFLVLGSVVLAITGAEAMYADMGHFGKQPIRLTWFVIVFPALVLNYFGQGALLLDHPEAVENPFFSLVPRPLLYPMVALATAATVIASQALISGAFSLTRQAVQLGFLPRVQIIHTSGDEEGQIYVPEVNWALMISCVGLVLTFRESSKLAAAYGIAVTMDMVITTCVFTVVTLKAWKWPWWKSLSLAAIFLLFDAPYLASNLLKFLDGGFVPILIAIVLFAVMTTWKRGRGELAARVKASTLPLDLFLDDVERREPHRVDGTAVFMFGDPNGTPPALLHHMKHMQVLHKQVVLLSIGAADEPKVPPAERLQVEKLKAGFWRLKAQYGFMETPNVPDLMRLAWRDGLATDPATTSYFLGRETLLTSGPSRMMRWRKGLFGFLSKNARTATSFYRLPPGRVVELGMQIDL